MLSAACITLIHSQSTAQSGSGIIDLESFTVTGRQLAWSEQFSSEGLLQTPLIETPRSLAVFNRTQIEDIGAQSIQDVLGYITGVHAGPYGVDSRLDSARIRGVSPLKFHDGFQTLFGFYNNTKAEIYTLEQVEVVKGPAAVLAGRGALGGVVNSVSKKPTPERIREVALQLGSFDRRQIGVDLGDRLNAEGTWLYRVVGVYRDSGTQVDHVPDDVKLLMPSLTWAPNAQFSVTLLANVQDNNGGQTLQFLPNEGTLLPGREIPTDTFIGEPGWDRYDTEQQAFSLFLNKAFQDDLTFSWNLRYTDGEADYKSHWVAYDGADPIVAADGTVNRTIYDAPATSEAFVWNAQLEWTPKTGRIEHQIVVGADAQDVTNDTDSYYGFAAGGRINIFNPVYGNLAPVLPVFDTPAEISEQLGFFLRDHATWGDWILSAGLRHDQVEVHSSGSGTRSIDADATTGDLGVLYRFENGWNPYFSWAESFEPLGTATGLDGSLLQLDPKEGTQYELGLKYQSEDGNTLLTFAGFDMQEKERPISNGVFVTQTNVDTRGFELELGQRWGAYHLQLGYSYVQAEDGNGFQIVTAPEHLANLWLGWEPREGQLQGWRSGIGIRHISKTWDDTDTLSTDAITLIDIMLGYAWEEHEISLNITNLADDVFVASTQGGRSYYGARRVISLSAKFRF